MIRNNLNSEAHFANLGLKGIPIADAIREHQKPLTSGVWCILTSAYVRTDKEHLWVIELTKPI
jgi:ATP-dependent Lon protease